MSEPGDPGSAASRTALAWERSGLSLAATGAVVARGVPGSGVGHRPVVGTLVAVLGLGVWVVTALSERRRRRALQRPIATPGDLALVSGATVVVGIVLFVLAAWPA